jgi:hypothetical protein
MFEDVHTALLAHLCLDALDNGQLSKAKVGASRRLIERSLPVGFRLNYVENRTPSGGDAVIQLSLLQSEL